MKSSISGVFKYNMYELVIYRSAIWINVVIFSASSLLKIITIYRSDTRSHLAKVDDITRLDMRSLFILVTLIEITSVIVLLSKCRTAFKGLLSMMIGTTFVLYHIIRDLTGGKSSCGCFGQGWSFFSFHADQLNNFSWFAAIIILLSGVLLLDQHFRLSSEKKLNIS